MLNPNARTELLCVAILCSTLDIMVPHNHRSTATDQKDSCLGTVGPEVATPHPKDPE